MYRDWFCNICTLQFDKKYVFDLHLSLVHGVEMEAKSEPQICEEITEKSQTTEKVCSNPKVDASLKYDKCDLLFKNKRKVKGHTFSVHEGKKAFYCKICDSGFTTNQSLKNHIARIHEGKKPFRCSICASSFSQKVHLNGHIASVHEENKRFKCNTLL